MASGANKQLQSDNIVIVLYGRQGCHLCDDVEEHIKRLAMEFPITYKVVNITGDMRLEEKYMFTIPVVEINGLETFVSVDSVVTEEELRVHLQEKMGKCE
ncbi:glutaredoxin family protein [Brevibacillus laterosporus]|uniref:glutaredoxin family protein n=1 Tax=Brevibacillus laterosporus TaxID=1465 RepID=UPI001EF1ED33|nr:glutaredoxin family protein [Brevibacillus laterosporus]MCG7319605.1 glutaredoxin family protein [Brevibacillus laterosporus]